MAKLPEFDPIEFLVNKTFGTVSTASGTTIIISAERRARTNPQLAKQIADYKLELHQRSREELEALVIGEQKRQQAEAIAKSELEERERFFNQQWATADFDHWSRAAHWTLDEAIALSFGKAPERVNWDKVKPFAGVSAFAFQYQRRRDLALRAVVWKQLFDPVLPGIFLAWANRTQLAVPAELAAAVVARGTQVADWKTLYDDLNAKFDEHHKRWMEIAEQKNQHIDRLLQRVEELQASLASTPATMPPSTPEKVIGARERESLLKLVIGMAAGGYGYDPTAARSEQPAAIASDLAINGIPLDVDTVRKWLKEAATLLAPKEAD